MALYDKADELVFESLRECLEGADLCLSAEQSKLGRGLRNDNGRLGVPAANLLFTLIDAMGAYGSFGRSGHRSTFSILNSHYFRQTLNDRELEHIYSLYRSNLSHNALIRHGLLIY